MTRNAVVFIAHSYGTGLIYHLAHLSCGLWQSCRWEGTDFFVCSHPDEQHRGAWALLRENIPEERLLRVSDYDRDVERAIAELFGRYRRVLVSFGGGRRQAVPMRRLRRRFGERAVFAATTHSYEHDTWLRLPVSFQQFLIYRGLGAHVLFQCPYAARRFFGGGWLLRRGDASVIPLVVEDVFSLGDADEPEEAIGAPDIRPLLAEQGWFNFVFLAVFRPEKGHLWLLNALAPVLREMVNVRLFFLGDGVRREKVAGRVRELRLEDQVVCPGMIPRRAVPWVLSKCQCALVPSRAETFGHCFAEPMAAGVPVIGTRVGVGEGLIQDMQTGLGISFGDGDGVRRAVRFMATHPGDAAGMGLAARDIALRLFSRDAVARAHGRLYHWLLDGGR